MSNTARLVYAILEFLENEIVTDAVSPEAAESLEGKDEEYKHHNASSVGIVFSLISFMNAPLYLVPLPLVFLSLCM